MNKKKPNSNEPNKEQLQGRSLSGELSSLLFRTVERINNTGNFSIYEKLQYLHHYIRILGKYVEEKDIRNVMITQALLDHAFYNFGLGKPLCLQIAARRGGRADKIKRGIWIAIEKYLPQSKIKTPSHMWRYFETRHSSDGDDAYETPDLNYKIWFARDITDNKPNGGLLIQRSFYGRESSITFKTFERYFYKIKHKMDLLQA